MVSTSRIILLHAAFSDIEASGGIGYTGSTNCTGSTCTKVNDYYSQVYLQPAFIDTLAYIPRANILKLCLVLVKPRLQLKFGIIETLAGLFSIYSIQEIPTIYIKFSKKYIPRYKILFPQFNLSTDRNPNKLAHCLRVKTSAEHPHRPSPPNSSVDRGKKVQEITTLHHQTPPPTKTRACLDFLFTRQPTNGYHIP